MITESKFERIIRHLEKYGNTIITNKDCKNDQLDNLLSRIEKEGFKIEMFYPGTNLEFDTIYHYVIHARKVHKDAKSKRKTKSAKKKL